MNNAPKETDIVTLDALISALQKLRETKGNCEIAIDDADTGWHLAIESIEPSYRYPSRLLISGSYHGYTFPEP